MGVAGTIAPIEDIVVTGHVRDVWSEELVKDTQQSYDNRTVGTTLATGPEWRGSKQEQTDELMALIDDELERAAKEREDEEDQV